MDSQERSWIAIDSQEFLALPDLAEVDKSDIDSVGAFAGKVLKIAETTDETSRSPAHQHAVESIHQAFESMNPQYILEIAHFQLAHNLGKSSDVWLEANPYQSSLSSRR